MIPTTSLSPKAASMFRRHRRSMLLSFPLLTAFSQKIRAVNRHKEVTIVPTHPYSTYKVSSALKNSPHRPAISPMSPKVPNIPNSSETELLGVHVCNHYTALASRNPFPPRTYNAVSMQGTHTHYRHTPPRHPARAFYQMVAGPGTPITGYS